MEKYPLAEILLHFSFIGDLKGTFLHVVFDQHLKPDPMPSNGFFHLEMRSLYMNESDSRATWSPYSNISLPASTMANDLKGAFNHESVSLKSLFSFY